MPVRQFPDVELLVVNYLRAQPGLAGVHVGTEFPNGAAFRTLLPVVRIGRVGGTRRIRQQLDEPLVDFDLWHDVHAVKALNDLTETCRAAVEAMRRFSGNGGVVTNTSEIAGPRDLPEDDPTLRRTGFTVSLLVRPL